MAGRLRSGKPVLTPAVARSKAPGKSGLRKVVEMVVIDRLSPVQIAEQTGWPLKIVKLLLQAAYRNLTGQPFPAELTRKHRDQARRDRAKAGHQTAA
jgi:hypothetical protein